MKTFAIAFFGGLLTYIILTVNPPTTNAQYEDYYFSYVYDTPKATGYASGTFLNRHGKLSAKDLADVKASVMKQNTNYMGMEILFIQGVKK